MSPERIVTVSVQVLPLTAEDVYAVVDQAIAAIKATGIRHEVCPMETVLEGTLTQCLAAARAAHEACFEAGVQRAVTYIKIADSVEGSTIDAKMSQYR